MDMNKQQLASKIWESANRMRSKIEANEYKDYILGFIFYKFLSETEVARLKAKDFSDDDLEALVEDDAEIVDFVQDECGYFIAHENLFQTWIAQGSDFEISQVRDALSAFSRNIAPAHRKVFDGIFDTLQTGLSKLGTDAKSQTKAARDLIYLIKDIPMDGRQGYDVLGFIYEYLISNFAANAGKKAGEFYTPHEVSVLMSEIVSWHLADREKITIYDPTSGSGSLLINIGKAVARRNGDPDAIKYYAQELKENTYNLTRMNLVMRGILPDNIVTRNGDTLEDDWPWFDTLDNKEETYEPLFVDAVVSNPPYSQNWDPEEKDIDARFAYGLAPKSKADYAFLLHDLFHLRPDGIMCIVLPHGVLFRGGEEGTIRKNLVENRHIQAIIGLPANIFFGTGIPTIIMVLRKQRDESGVLVVDASRHFVKEGKNNKLRASDIKRIADAVTNNWTADKFSRLVSIEEIRANDYNLNIPRYVDSSEAAESWDIYASMFGGVPASEVDALGEYWDVWPSLKEELYELGEPCYQPKTPDVGKAVAANQDVVSFVEDFEGAMRDFPWELKVRLIDNLETVDAVAGEAVLSEILDGMLESIPLVSGYEAYQILDDAWSTITIDVETIQAEGFDAIRAVDPNMVLKKQKGQEVEVQDGWVGRILPFELVQRELLEDELGQIRELEMRLEEISQAVGEMLEGLDEEERESAAVNDEGDAFVAAELKKAVKAIGKNPESEFDNVLVKAQQLLDEEKQLKKQVKDLVSELEDKTKKTIERLDNSQCIQLLEAKWIVPLHEGLQALPKGVLDDFASKVVALNSKYAVTHSDVCSQISEAERELSAMLGELTGDAADLAGINELMTLLGGE
jgi:type I restriction enzyme M protein